MDIKDLILIFENCEIAILKCNMISYLHINGIKENLSVNFAQYKEGKTRRNKECEELYLKINNIGLEQKSLIGDIENETLRKRLSICDIVSIELTYYNNSKEEIYVPWSDKDEYINLYQKNTEEEDSILIEIKPSDKP